MLFGQIEMAPCNKHPQLYAPFPILHTTTHTCAYATHLPLQNRQRRTEQFGHRRWGGWEVCHFRQGARKCRPSAVSRNRQHSSLVLNGHSGLGRHARTPVSWTSWLPRTFQPVHSLIFRRENYTIPRNPGDVSSSHCTMRLSVWGQLLVK